MSIENQAADGEPTSLREDLAAAYRAVEEREAGAEGGESTGQEIGQERQISAENGGDPAQQEISADRADGRDAQGRFAAKAKEGDGAAAAQAAAEQSNAAAAAGQTEDAAPASWKASGKAAWANIPPEARTEILRREREASEMAGRMDGERRFGREVAEIIRPHMQTIEQFGVTPQFAINTLLQNDRIMRTGTIEQKVGLAYKMLQDYGLNPAAFAQPQPGVSQDPHVRRLEQEIAQLRHQNAAPQQQDVAPLPQAAPDAMQAEIEAFRSDPAHPHFEQVLPVMTALLESGQAPDLKEAYEQAVWSNPTLRSTLQGQQQSPPVAQRQSQATNTAAARRADVSVSSSPGPSGSARPTTLRDELKQQLQAHGYT